MKQAILHNFLKLVMIIALIFVSLSANRGGSATWSPENFTSDPSNPVNSIELQPENQNLNQRKTAYILHYETPLALSPHDHFLLSSPMEYTKVFWTTADYHYGYFVKEFGNIHRGLDIPAVEGTPVLASGDGEVVFAGYGLLYGPGAKNDPYGIAIKIRHTALYEDRPVYSVYTHLEKTLVRVGEKVKTGETIGTVGLTGNTSGPHLHYEVRILTELGQLNQNPELWLAPPLDHGVLAGRIANRYGYLLNNWKFVLSSLDTGREWVISTYDPEIITYHEQDPYYQENYVLGDLPAGSYQLSTWYNYKYYTRQIEIIPGAVNYINFDGVQGFHEGVPPGSMDTDFLD